MALKVVIENLDDVEEAERGFYKEFQIKDKDGKPKTVLALDLDALDSHPGIASLRNAFERQKAENATLKSTNAELKGKVEGLPEEFTVEEFERLKAFEVEAKKTTDDPSKVKAHETEIQSIKTMNAQALDGLKRKLEVQATEHAKEIAKHIGTIHRLLVEDGLSKALGEVGVKPEYLKAARAMLSKSVKVVETDGEQTAVVETDLGPSPVNEFVAQWAKSDEGKHFVAPPKGGDAPGGSGSKELGPNPFSATNWNVTDQNKLMNADRARAERLAKAAGFKDAVSAHRKEDAKDFKAA